MNELTNERLKEMEQSCEDANYDDMASALRELRNLREQTRWRDVKDELPIDNLEVFVAVTSKYGDRFTMSGYYLTNGEWVWDTGDGRCYFSEYSLTVTHWTERILPAPPPIQEPK